MCVTSTRVLTTVQRVGTKARAGILGVESLERGYLVQGYFVREYPVRGYLVRRYLVRRYFTACDCISCDGTLFDGTWCKGTWSIYRPGLLMRCELFLLTNPVLYFFSI